VVGVNRTYLVGENRVACTAAPEDHAYLRDFYPETVEPATVTIRVEQVDGVWEAVLDDDLRLPYPGRAAVDALRLAARAHWLATLPAGSVLLPAAGLRVSGVDFVLVGKPKSGKTTLLLDAVLRHHATALAYDALVLDVERGVGHHVPSIMNARHDTIAALPGAHELLSGHELALGGAPGERYYRPGAFPVPTSFRTSRRPVLVFLDGFAPDDEAGLGELTPDEAAARLRDLVAVWGGYDDVDRVGTARARAAAAARTVVDGFTSHTLRHHGCPVIVTDGSGTPCRHSWKQLLTMSTDR
jgi:hypothetical protein